MFGSGFMPMLAYAHLRAAPLIRCNNKLERIFIFIYLFYFRKSLEWMNLHNIVVSGDELDNDSEQYEHNTGKAYETGTGQSRYIFIQTQWDDNAHGDDKHNTKPYLGHRCVPRWHKAYQYFWQCIADDHIVRNHCCVQRTKNKKQNEWKNLT